MSINRQHLPPEVETTSPLAGLAGAGGMMGGAEDFGSNEMQQQHLQLAQVVTDNGIRGGPRPTPRPAPPQPRPAPRPRRA